MWETASQRPTRCELNGIEVHGQAIVLGVDHRAVVITVSSHDAGETRKLADAVRDSLSPTR